MLRSYTSAINKQENRSGSLFRKETKARCLTEVKGVSPAYFSSASGTYLNIDFPERNYVQQCFDYIHYNPVEAGLVDKPEDWAFSSYRNYKCIQVEKIVNKNVANEFGLEW
ncbi:hypothetical protein ACE1ET_05220 [Saccharicrinis sp. FJH62]|uniref:hypothetical protein n=1 Tax=Saccharicrinis sp. FJH62 TaxID=3344657 RepID=UPI0035D4C688